MAHPIETIMTTTMENLKDMIDVSTVVGAPVRVGDEITVIPVSRVSFGFVSGGGEYGQQSLPLPLDNAASPLPFAGGTGAGISVSPVAFLLVSRDQVRLLPATTATPLERLIELLPESVSALIKNVQEPGAEEHPRVS